MLLEPKNQIADDWYIKPYKSAAYPIRFAYLICCSPTVYLVAFCCIAAAAGVISARQFSVGV